MATTIFPWENKKKNILLSTAPAGQSFDNSLPAPVVAPVEPKKKLSIVLKGFKALPGTDVRGFIERPVTNLIGPTEDMSTLVPKEGTDYAGPAAPPKQETAVPNDGILSFKNYGGEKPIQPRIIENPNGPLNPVRLSIDPYNDTLNADIQRQKQSGIFAPVSGGNVSQMTMSAEQQAEVAKRKEAGSAALDSYNDTLDRANILEGAHGPFEAQRAIRRIAAMDATKNKGILSPLEQAKVQSEIDVNKSREKLAIAQATQKDPAIEAEAQKASITARQKALDAGLDPDEEGQKAYDFVINQSKGLRYTPGTPGEEPGIFSSGIAAVPGSWKSSQSAPTQADLEHTAQIHGISVEEVKKKLGIA